MFLSAPGDLCCEVMAGDEQFWTGEQRCWAGDWLDGGAGERRWLTGDWQGGGAGE